MKYKLILISIFLISFFGSYSQTIYHNLEKYWAYRDRLEQHHMIVGSPDLPGTNWPQNLFGENRKIIGTGENPTAEFAEYLCVLATEYRLLKDYNECEKASETLEKIAWALASFDRVDQNAEKYFRYRENSNKPDNNPNFWVDVEEYNYPEDLNGFFLRGDADGPCYINGQCNRNADSYPPPDTTLLEYNNGQLKEPFPGHFIESVSCRINTARIIDSYNRTVESQDEVWTLLMGLALINKLVDDPQLFMDSKGNQITIRYWAKNITWRVVNALRQAGFFYSWKIKNPITNEIIDPGGVIPLPYLFACAGDKICGDQYPTLQNAISLDIESKQRVGEYLTKELMVELLKIPGSNFEPAGNLNLAMIAGMKNASYYFDLYDETSDGLQIIANEHLPALFSLLNGIDLESELEQEEYEQYQNDFLYVLNQAKDCGAWYEDRFDENWNLIPTVSDLYWYTNRNGEVNDIMKNPKWYEGMDTRLKTGLNYMFFHNLYWLTFLNHPYILNETIDYPYMGEGTFENPLFESADYINASNSILSGGDVTYAGKYSVKLKTGFHAYQDSRFRSYTTDNEPDISYRYIYYYGTCVYPFKRLLPNDWTDGLRNDSLMQDTIYTKYEKDYTSDIEENETNGLTIQSGHINQNKNSSIKSVIDKDIKKDKCIVFPSLFNSEIYIISNENKGNLSHVLELYNANSLLVHTQIMINNNETIHTEKLAKGMYFLRIITGEDVFTYKLIKQ